MVDNASFCQHSIRCPRLLKCVNFSPKPQNISSENRTNCSKVEMLFRMHLPENQSEAVSSDYLRSYRRPVPLSTIFHFDIRTFPSNLFQNAGLTVLSHIQIMLGLDKFGIFAFKLGSRRRFQHGLSVTLGSQLRYHNKSEYRWCQKCDTDLYGTILPCTYCKMQPILLNTYGLNFGQKIIFIRKIVLRTPY